MKILFVSSPGPGKAFHGFKTAFTPRAAKKKMFERTEEASGRRRVSKVGVSERDVFSCFVLLPFS